MKYVIYEYEEGIKQLFEKYPNLKQYFDNLTLDNDFMNDSDLIGVHPNDNTATVWLKAKDLVKLIQKHGNTVNTIQI